MAASSSPAAALGLVVLFLATAVLVVLGFVLGPGLPDVATEHGAGIDRVIHYLLWTTGAIFVVGHLVLARFVWKYSRGNSPPFPGLNNRLEWKWAIVAVVIMCVVAEGGVVVVGMPVFKAVYGDAPEDALVIEVVGKQFEWLVRYPGADGAFGRTEASLVHDVRNPVGLDREDPAARDDIVRRGALNLPRGRTVVLRLNSLDVLHSFTVPEFRTKQDLIPGFTAYTQFLPTKNGRYEIACAELCGLGHFRMRGFVTVQDPDDFETWLSEEEPWL